MLQHYGLASRSPARAAWAVLIITAVLTACGGKDAPPAPADPGVVMPSTMTNPTLAEQKAACGTGVTPCDSTNLGGATCGSVGAGSGTLLCDPVTCTYDTTMCMPTAPTTTGAGGLGGSFRPQPSAGAGAGGSDEAAGTAGIASVSGTGGTYAAGASAGGGGISGSSGSSGGAGSSAGAGGKTAGSGGASGGGGSAGQSGASGH